MPIKRHLYMRQQLGTEGRVGNKTHGPSTVGPTEWPDSGCWHSGLIASRRTKDPHSSLQRKCPVYRARIIKQRPTAFFKCGLAKLPGRNCPARSPRREVTWELKHGSSSWGFGIRMLLTPERDFWQAQMMWEFRLLKWILQYRLHRATMTHFQ